MAKPDRRVTAAAATIEEQEAWCRRLAELGEREQRHAALLSHLSAPPPGSNVVPIRAPHALNLTPQPEREPLEPLELPPGNAGHLAEWMLSTARLPMAEAPVVATLGLLAGICGRAFTTPGEPTGLNIYLILVARSGTGKELLHNAPSALLAKLRERVPAVVHMINFDDHVSGPALMKACASGLRSFVTFNSEFGRSRFKRFANPKDAPMAELRTAITKLYSKSGPTSYVGDLLYSKERTTIAGPVAFSLVGETTPGTLRAAMTADMMEDGFMSRFGWVVYEGDMPYRNAYPDEAVPTPYLAGWLEGLVVHAATLLSRNVTQQVAYAENSKELLDDYLADCDSRVRAAGDNEARRQVWVRAHLKALKYASLLAVADNHGQPAITPRHAFWAMELVRRDIATFEAALDSGDVGNDASAQELKLLSILGDYLSKPVPASQGVPEALRKAGIVPRKYLQRRTSDIAAFKAHPRGPTVALDDALRSLSDSGYIIEVDKVEVAKEYTFQGRCFRILVLPNR